MRYEDFVLASPVVATEEKETFDEYILRVVNEEGSEAAAEILTTRLEEGLYFDDDGLSEYLDAIEALKDKAESRRARVKFLTKLAKQEETACSVMEEQLLGAMVELEQEEIEADRHTVKRVKSGNPRVVTSDVAPEDVDERFRREVPAKTQFDLRAIRAALEAEEELDFATLEYSERIKISERRNGRT